MKIVKYTYNKNLKRFFFKAIRKKFIREKRRFQIKNVANQYYIQQLKNKCIKYWQKVI